jgi:hypothetical protein
MHSLFLAITTLTKKQHKKKSPSSEVDRRSAGHETARRYSNQKVL